MTITPQKLTSISVGDTSLEVNFATSHVEAVLLEIPARDGDIGGEAQQILHAELLVGNHVTLQDVVNLVIVRFRSSFVTVMLMVIKVMK